uniref:glutathione transferase n=1 Tax=Brachionus rotundiformis TaxID=96890 RepID=A0A3G2JSS0_9BILA|nr:glutathione S-transferase S13 [Brachionus rotundiformis]
MSLYKLTYFNGRGRAELARLIFAAAGVSFEDETFPFSEWPGNFKADTPLGQVPYLTIDGEKIPQSIAFSRMLAKRFNMVGNDEFEQLRTDVVVDTVTDLQNNHYLREYDETVIDNQAAMEKFKSDEIPVHLERIEKIVSLYGNEGFSVGNSLKWSDLHVYDITSSMLKFDPNILNKYPKIQAIRKTVETNEKIAAYLKARPETEF